MNELKCMESNEVSVFSSYSDTVVLRKDDNGEVKLVNSAKDRRQSAYVVNFFAAERPGKYFSDVDKDPLYYDKGDIVLTVATRADATSDSKYHDFVIHSPFVCNTVLGKTAEEPTDKDCPCDGNCENCGCCGSCDETLEEGVNSFSDTDGAFGKTTFFKTSEDEQLQEISTISDDVNATDYMESLPTYNFVGDRFLLVKCDEDRNIGTVPRAEAYNYRAMFFIPEKGILNIDGEKRYVGAGSVVVTFYDDHDLENLGFKKVETFSSLWDMYKHLLRRNTATELGKLDAKSNDGSCVDGPKWIG